MKHKLIVLEGIDGVGKTTIAHLLKQALSERGIRTVLYEDSEKRNEGFNVIKPFIKREVSVAASFFFYIASAIYKSGQIEVLLEKGWVICDRYIYSTFAHHKVRGADLSLVSHLPKLPIRLPDFHFLVKAREDVRMERAQVRKGRTPQDLIPKKKGSLIEKMEQALEQFKPIIVDNTDPDPHVAVSKIMETLQISAPRRKK